MNKYSAMTQCLSQLPTTREAASFRFIEELIGSDLPPSARKYRPWWGNQLKSGGRQCTAWLKAGWRVETIDLIGETAVFIRS